MTGMLISPFDMLRVFILCSLIRPSAQKRRRAETFQLCPPLETYFCGSILTESLPLKRVESKVAPVRTASVLPDDKSDNSPVLK